MNRLLIGTLAAIITITGPGGYASTGDTTSGQYPLKKALAREATLAESHTRARRTASSPQQYPAAAPVGPW